MLEKSNEEIKITNSNSYVIKINKKPYTLIIYENGKTGDFSGFCEEIREAKAEGKTLQEIKANLRKEIIKKLK